MFKRILALYIEQKWWVLTVTLLIFVSRGITLLIPYLFGLTTDAIIRHEPINVPVVLSLWQLALEGVNRLIQVVRQRVDQEHVWFPIQERLRFQTLGNYLKFSIGQLKQTPVGMSKEILSSGENSMMQIGQLLVRRLVPMTVQFLAIAGLLFWQNYRLALVVVGGLTLYGIAQRFMERKYTPLIALRRDKNLTSYNTRGEILSAATLIKAYSKEGFAEERYKKDYLASIETSKEVNRYINKYDTSIAFLINVTQVGAFLYGLHMVYSGQITFGYLTTISVWCAQMCNMINVLGDEYQGFLDNLSNVRKFFELIDTPPMIREIPDPVTPDQIAGFIQLKQVTFIYPPRKRFGDEKEAQKDNKGVNPRKKKKVLEEVSLSIEAGSRVAIVGPSGEGKSTLVSLIQRAYDPTSGVVEIDGVNIRNLNLREFCRHIGVVDQGSLTINLSIRENVALGSQNPMTDEDIIECCRLAQLDVFSFDDGLDTIVGDMGSGISGGERQRIAIARAIASNPRILIFDEPTSSLDAMTEAKIKETIKKVSKGRTTIIIAHRLSTIQDCDKIFVMEKGRITASGTHTDLLDSSPTYRQFAEEQRIAI